MTVLLCTNERVKNTSTIEDRRVVNGFGVIRVLFVAVLTTFLLGESALAQTGIIKGNVVQINSDAVLEDVTIYIPNTPFGTISNGQGVYVLNEVSAGEVVLVAANVGYGSVRKTITVLAGETVTVDFELDELVMDLPPVVIASITMTGGNKGVNEIPGSAHYISPKEIQKYSYTDINKTLRAVPGINIQEEDGFGLRPNIGLRGTGVERSSKITIMEDGVLMAPAPYAAPAAYYFPTIGRMQAVEVLKGSSQIKYGPYTTGGAINLISTQIPSEFAGKFDMFVGSFGGRSLHAVAGDSKKQIGYSVETFQYMADGFKTLDGGGSTGFDKKDYLAKLRINTKLDAKVYQSLTFKVGYANEISHETYLGLTEEDFDADPLRRYAASQKDLMSTNQNQFQIRHVASFSENLNLTTTMYRSEFARNWYKLDKVEADSIGGQAKIAEVLDNPVSNSAAYAVITGASSYDDALHVKANNRSYYSKGMQSVMNYSFGKEKVKSAVEVGVRLHQDQIDRFQWVDKYKMNEGRMLMTTRGTPGTESNRVETARAFAAYVQYRAVINKLTLIPGLRYENVTINRVDYGKSDPERQGTSVTTRNNWVDVWIPGIGIDYKFSKVISSFAGVHKGFSPPGSKEGTLPEESINYELGIRFHKRALTGQAVVFLNDYSNLLGSDLAAAGGGGSNDQYNGGEVQAMGVETQFTYNLLTRVSTRFNMPFTIVYTYTDAAFKSDFDSDFEGWGEVQAGDKLPYIAAHQASFSLGIENKTFGFSISGKLVDEMRTTAGQDDLDVVAMTDEQFILDLSGNYIISNNVSLFANVTNLTNNVNIVARRPAGLRPGMPRAVKLGIKASF